MRIKAMIADFGLCVAPMKKLGKDKKRVQSLQRRPTRESIEASLMPQRPLISRHSSFKQQSNDPCVHSRHGIRRALTGGDASLPLPCLSHHLGTPQGDPKTPRPPSSPSTTGLSPGMLDVVVEGCLSTKNPGLEESSLSADLTPALDASSSITERDGGDYVCCQRDEPLMPNGQSESLPRGGKLLPCSPNTPTCQNDGALMTPLCSSTPGSAGSLGGCLDATRRGSKISSSASQLDRPSEIRIILRRSSEMNLNMTSYQLTGIY